jgi:apolipoprotein N-acyltransferase
MRKQLLISINTWSPWHFYLACLGAGTLSVFAFQPIGFFPTAFVSFILFLHLLNARAFKTNKEVFAAGWWFGLGYFVTGLYWMALACHVDWIKFGWVFPFAALGLPSCLALGAGASTLIAHVGKRVSPLMFMLLFAFAWSAFEWIRGHIFTGLPWLNLAEIWPISIAQSVSCIGTYGLGLLTLLMIAGLFLASVRGVLCACALLLGLYGYGTHRLSQALDATFQDFNLVLVQPSIPQVYKWDPKHFQENISILVTLSRRAGQAKPRVFIWPEASIPGDITQDKHFRAQLTHFMSPEDLLILGAPRFEGEKLYNSLLVLNAQGDVLAHYDKSHLVPFGEYMPWRSFLPSFVGKLTAGTIDYSPGPGIQTLTIPNLPPFSPLVCFEAIFPGAVVLKSSPAPQWLLNITNDGWYLNSSGPYQHVQITRLRAIEEGLPLVRVVYLGVSVAFDAYGRQVGHIPYGEKTALTIPLPKPIEDSQAPLYRTWGDKLYFGLLALLCLWIIGLYRVRNRSS